MSEERVLLTVRMVTSPIPDVLRNVPEMITDPHVEIGEVQQIAELESGRSHAAEFGVDPQHKVDIWRLRELMDRGGAHVLHFGGHGLTWVTMDEGGTQQLLFIPLLLSAQNATSGHDIQVYDSDAFLRELSTRRQRQDSQTPFLFVLMGCETSVFAKKLVEYMPWAWAVAWHSKLLDPAAAVFSRHFYAALFRAVESDLVRHGAVHSSVIEHAFNVARQSLETENFLLEDPLLSGGAAGSGGGGETGGSPASGAGDSASAATGGAGAIPSGGGAPNGGRGGKRVAGVPMLFRGSRTSAEAFLPEFDPRSVADLLGLSRVRALQERWTRRGGGGTVPRRIPRPPAAAAAGTATAGAVFSSGRTVHPRRAAPRRATAQQQEQHAHHQQRHYDDEEEEEEGCGVYGTCNSDVSSASVASSRSTLTPLARATAAGVPAAYTARRPGGPSTAAAAAAAAAHHQLHRRHPHSASPHRYPSDSDSTVSANTGIGMGPIMVDGSSCSSEATGAGCSDNGTSRNIYTEHDDEHFEHLTTGTGTEFNIYLMGGEAGAAEGPLSMSQQQQQRAQQQHFVRLPFRHQHDSLAHFHGSGGGGGGGYRNHNGSGGAVLQLGKLSAEGEGSPSLATLLRGGCSGGGGGCGDAAAVGRGSSHAALEECMDDLDPRQRMQAHQHALLAEWELAQRQQQQVQQQQQPSALSRTQRVVVLPLRVPVGQGQQQQQMCSGPPDGLLYTTDIPSSRIVVQSRYRGGPAWMPTVPAPGYTVAAGAGAAGAAFVTGAAAAGAVPLPSSAEAVSPSSAAASTAAAAAAATASSSTSALTSSVQGHQQHQQHLNNDGTHAEAEEGEPPFAEDDGYDDADGDDDDNEERAAGAQADLLMMDLGGGVFGYAGLAAGDDDAAAVAWQRKLKLQLVAMQHALDQRHQQEQRGLQAPSPSSQSQPQPQRQLVVEWLLPPTPSSTQVEVGGAGASPVTTAAAAGGAAAGGDNNDDITRKDEQLFRVHTGFAQMNSLGFGDGQQVVVVDTEGVTGSGSGTGVRPRFPSPEQRQQQQQRGGVSSVGPSTAAAVAEATNTRLPTPSPSSPLSHQSSAAPAPVIVVSANVGGGDDPRDDSSVACTTGTASSTINSADLLLAGGPLDPVAAIAAAAQAVRVPGSEITEHYAVIHDSKMVDFVSRAYSNQGLDIDQWVCERCSYANNDLMPMCEACEGAR